MNSRRSAPMLVLALLLVPAVALAAKAYAHRAEHLTQKSPEHVLAVITAYKDTCDKGCKYEGDNVQEFVKVTHKATPARWYTWTHVSNFVNTTKYFCEVTLSKNDGGFVYVTRQLEEKDKAVIDELVRVTGQKHDPFFDTGVTRFEVSKLTDGKTKVVQDMKLTATGPVTMFPGKIQAGMENGAKTTFANIEK